jgi:glyoxylase-like metal-dependent hydrolase (beta-lactamase superfamily II)
MASETIAVGRIEIVALLDGVGELEGPIEEHFPAVTAEATSASRDRWPGVYGPAGGWRLHVRSWLIRHPDGLVLVDTGVGRRGAPGPEWFGREGSLLDALRGVGTGPEDIDTVVLTHVHDDHVGGTVTFRAGEPMPAFPRARYLLQRADREWQTSLARDEEEDAAIDELLLQPLERSGQLELIDGDHVIADGIELQLAAGHTPGHQIVRTGSAGAGAIVTADAFNHPLQLHYPEWASVTDADPEVATTTRRALIDELVAHPGTTVAPTHLAEPFGEVRAGSDGLATWVGR